MDRQLIYPASIPLETDLLNAQRNSMVGMAKLAAAVLGTLTTLNGLACTPTAPASLQVYVAPGEINSVQNLDGTAYSSLAADTTHTILKQGILLDQATLTCPAPVTTGQSINYLVQVAYQDIDDTAVVLPYYNASNPATAYSGPSNSGTAQNTRRRGACVVTVKAGTSAVTGSQTTPAPDAGCTGAWVVTVANGQTQINSANITAYVGAPFLPAGGLSSFGVLTVAATSTLGIPAANVTVLINSASNTTQTLPAASAVPAGRRMEFFNMNTGTGTVQRAGSDTLTLGSSTVTSLAAGAGDTFTLESNGVNGWYVVAGSVQLGASAGFGKLFASAGYQKLPSGFLMQWGQNVSSGTSVGNYSVTFPIAFPTACLVALLTTTAGNATVNLATNTTTGLTATTYTASTGTITSTMGALYLAIGY